MSGSLETLIALRFLQGGFSTTPAVFAPGILRALYGDARAVGALGLLGSIEALAPALAPIAGVWLLAHFGWTGGFDAIAVTATMLALIMAVFGRRLPARLHGTARADTGGCFGTGRSCHALGCAFTIGALLVAVFGAPTVFVQWLAAVIVLSVRRRVDIG